MERIWESVLEVLLTIVEKLDPLIDLVADGMDLLIALGEKALVEFNDWSDGWNDTEEKKAKHRAARAVADDNIAKAWKEFIEDNDPNKDLPIDPFFDQLFKQRPRGFDKFARKNAAPGLVFGGP